jgi:hypothetical protein
MYYMDILIIFGIISVVVGTIGNVISWLRRLDRGFETLNFEAAATLMGTEEVFREYLRYLSKEALGKDLEPTTEDAITKKFFHRYKRLLNRLLEAFKEMGPGHGPAQRAFMRQVDQITNGIINFLCPKVKNISGAKQERITRKFLADKLGLIL